MKIRNGFVSNSSSSSFIINRAMTTAQVALIMLYEVKSDWLKDSYDADRNIPNNFKNAIDWLAKNQEYNKPLIFPWSCNYETFIWANGNGICIDTCNNHNWNILAPRYCGEFYYNAVDDPYPTDDNSEEFYENAHDEYLDLSRMECMTREEFSRRAAERWSSK